MRDGLPEWWWVRLVPVHFLTVQNLEAGWGKDFQPIDIYPNIDLFQPKGVFSVLGVLAGVLLLVLWGLMFGVIVYLEEYEWFLPAGVLYGLVFSLVTYWILAGG